MEHTLTFSCPDRTGLVRTVASWLFDQGCNIIDSDQFGDTFSGRFFMRVHFSGNQSTAQLREGFQRIAAEHHMEGAVWPCERKANVLVMVSRLDHCLIDLVYRTRNGELPISIALVVSNHTAAERIARHEGIEFLHLPVTPETRARQEAVVLEKITTLDIDFVVLARYMQVLSPDFCAAMPARIINIHHSFLPSFKGARPYHQAHAKGVKLIGATAHYVTGHLDEGPIIEQSVERVDHRATPATLAAVGRDTERMVLAKAVRYQAEHRVLLNGDRTVVFP